jgi:hypothetical protein
VAVAEDPFHTVAEIAAILKTKRKRAARIDALPRCSVGPDLRDADDRSIA